MIKLFNILKWLHIISHFPKHIFKTGCTVWINYSGKEVRAKFLCISGKAYYISFTCFHRIELELLEDIEYSSTHGPGGTFKIGERIKWLSTRDVLRIEYKFFI